MDRTTTTDKKFKCLECQNEITVTEGLKKGDFFECEFCGIEYIVEEVTTEGEYVVKISEEEK